MHTHGLSKWSTLNWSFDEIWCINAGMIAPGIECAQIAFNACGRHDLGDGARTYTSGRGNAMGVSVQAGAIAICKERKEKNGEKLK